MGGIVDSIFGGGQSQAYRDLQSQIQRGMQERQLAQGKAEEALSPYFGGGPGAGLNFLQQYSGELGKQQNAPQYLNDILSQYKQSPYAQQLQHQGQQALGAAAASSGMLGSGAYGKQMAQMAEDISAKDMQQYLQNVLGIHGQYLQGLGGLEQQGYGAAGEIFKGRQGLGQDVASLYGSLGQAMAGEDASRGAGLQNLLGLGLGALTGGLGYIPGLAGGIGGALGGGLGLYKYPSITGLGGPTYQSPASSAYIPGQGMAPYRLGD